LPYGHDAPAFLPQRSRDSTVTPFIDLYLRRPENGVRPGKLCSWAIPMAVPEATVHKDCRFPRSDGKVRLPGQTSIVPPVFQSELAKKRAHAFLGRGTFVSHAAQDLVTFRLAVDVCHDCSMWHETIRIRCTSVRHSGNSTHATLLCCQIERKIAYITQPAPIYEFLQLLNVRFVPHLRDSLDKLGKGDMICAVHVISTHCDGGKAAGQRFKGDDHYA
jgi:hypothetical protein